MATIPLYVFLFIYFAGALLFAVLVLINLGHLFHTGTFTLTSFFVTFLCLAASALILWATWYALAAVDWQTPVTIWDKAWLGSVFSKAEFVTPF